MVEEHPEGEPSVGRAWYEYDDVFRSYLLYGGREWREAKSAARTKVEAAIRASVPRLPNGRTVEEDRAWAYEALAVQTAATAEARLELSELREAATAVSHKQQSC